MKYKDKYDLIFLATHQNNNYIYKLLNSINIVESFNLLVVILSQEVKLEISSLNFDLKVLEINKTSLSKARNIGLNFLSKHNINSKYIMFPDDDSTFDISFFENFNDVTASGDNFIMPIYEEKSEPKKLYMGKIVIENQVIPESFHSLIGSPNQLIRYNTNTSKLHFDEKLGVGAIYGSCEDYDLFIRLNRAGEKFLYTSKIYNFHPKKTDVYKSMSLKQIVNRFKNYSSGFCYVIYKYDLKQFLFMFLFRTFAASIIFILRFNLKLSLAYLIQFFDRIVLIRKFSKIKSC